MRSFILIKILVFNRKLQSLDLSYMSLISVPGGLPSTKLTFALILSSVSILQNIFLSAQWIVIASKMIVACSLEQR